MSFATSIIATGTPCEWHATRMKSACLIWSIQFSSNFQSVFTRSAIKPSPSRAICSISGEYPRASVQSLIAAAAALAKRIEVPVGWPSTFWIIGAGKKPCTPIATAFLMRGGAGLMCRCGIGASPPWKYWRICCQKLGWWTKRYVVLNSGKRRFGGSCLSLVNSFDAGVSAGAVSGRVGFSTGDVLVGVAALLDAGDSGGVSLGLASCDFAS
jgi:hypothetical protein